MAEGTKVHKVFPFCQSSWTMKLSIIKWQRSDQSWPKSDKSSETSSFFAKSTNSLSKVIYQTYDREFLLFLSILKNKF